MPRKTRTAGEAYAQRRTLSYFAPFEASRNAASSCRRSVARAPANGGIGEPGIDARRALAGGATWKSMPWSFAPFAVRSGAPRLPSPRRGRCGSSRQPSYREQLRARDRLRVVGEALLLRPRRHFATAPSRAPPSRSRPCRSARPSRGSTRIAATIATGRRSGRRSARRSMNGSASSSTRQIVGIADRAEDHRLRPLEDPEQVEEEVEVPVGPRDEADRSRVGRLVVELPEPAGEPRARGGRPAS